MVSIQENVEKTLQKIDSAAKKYNKNPNNIQLLAVSKTKPISNIQAAIDSGLTQFGENYVQEGIEKVQFFADKNNQLTWHLIGPIQSNKTRLIAEHFDWVHSIERSKIAQRLNDQRPHTHKPLQVLIQVNTSAEASKSGLSSANQKEIIALADEITQLPNLTLRGLMCIPEPSDDFATQLAAFTPLTALFAELKTRYSQFDTLSMGMSDDMEAAIASGSTMVRVGSAIFGARNYG